MQTSRRQFLATGAALGAITVLPFSARAAAHGGNTFESAGGPITVHPVHHASMVLETPKGVIYVDPVGESALYEGMPAPDLILVTHEHGDHYSAEVLSAIIGEASLVTNPAVHEMLPEDLKAGAEVLANGESRDWNGLMIDAIPAYNTTPEREQFHPQGRDNGYVLGFEDFRIYISGDTEDTPEMRALENIDVALVCMNLPFTMDAEAAAAGVSAFGPKVVYPYHYRGRDGGTQDPEEFASMLRDGIEMRNAAWYEEGELG